MRGLHAVLDCDQKGRARQCPTPPKTRSA